MIIQLVQITIPSNGTIYTLIVSHNKVIAKNPRESLLLKHGSDGELNHVTSQVLINILKQIAIELSVEIYNDVILQLFAIFDVMNNPSSSSLLNVS